MNDYRLSRPADDAAIDIVEVVLPLEQAINHAGTEEELSAIFARATLGQRLLTAYNNFFFEVEWNGLAGYFENAGDRWRDVLAATQQFNLPNDEQLLRRALSLFPGGAPADDLEERRAQVDAINEENWNELDVRWTDIQAAGTDAGIRHYILAHPDEFFLP